MKYEANYTVEGELSVSTFDCDFPPHSIAYCCSTCGNIWGKVIVRPVGGNIAEKNYFDFQSVPCREHKPLGAPDWNRLPGSMLHSNKPKKSYLSKMWWAVALEHLPPQVLNREFELHWKEYEEKQNGKTE